MADGRALPDSGGADSPRGPHCPPPEVLAAWVDQGLGAAEREQFEAHLAGCDECRVLLAHTLETHDAVGASRTGLGETVAHGDFPPPAPHLGRRLLAWARWVLGGGALVAATMLLVAQL
jgi:anti-sigma factor RsiW